MGEIAFGATERFSLYVRILREVQRTIAISEQQNQHFKHWFGKMEICASIPVGILFAIRLEPRKSHVEHTIRQQWIQMRCPIVDPVDVIALFARGRRHRRIDNFGN